MDDNRTPWRISRKRIYSKEFRQWYVTASINLILDFVILIFQTEYITHHSESVGSGLCPSSGILNN
jgi:hypothetical protein